MPKSNLSENTAQLFVLGLPKGQPRVKAYSRGGVAGVYDPGTADPWKHAIASEAKAIGLAGKNLQGPVAMSVTCYFPRPKAHFNSKGEVKPAFKSMVCYPKKPDADNLLKAVMDILTRCAVWGDDSQVYLANLSKSYVSNNEPPQTDIILNWRE